MNYDDNYGENKMNRKDWEFEYTTKFLADAISVCVPGNYRQFKKAMKESGLPEATANEVLRNFRDIMAMKEVELRKQTEKVESTFVKN